MELWESTAMESVLITVPSNLQDIVKCVLYHPAFLLLRSPSGTLKKEGDMCKTYFFFSILFVAVLFRWQDWKKPKFSSTEEQVNKWVVWDPLESE